MDDYIKDWKAKFQNAVKEKSIKDETVKAANDFGEFLTKNDDVNKEKSLSTTQLRRFYGEVKRIQMLGYEEHKSDFILLKPKLAYAVGRDTNQTKINTFYNVISSLIDIVHDKEQFDNFIKIFEAIVAYHKKYEKEKENEKEKRKRENINY